MSIGKNIQKAREQAGLSQRELGERACISETFVSHVERGAKKPSVDTFAKIADVLGCSMDALYRRAGPE